jgi:serine phosphatase RsbU (regulator of sigma subunit)
MKMVILRRNFFLYHLIVCFSCILISLTSNAVFASEKEDETKNRIRDIQVKINNFNSLSLKEKQKTLNDQNQLITDQFDEFDLLEAKLRKQRNYLIIQSGDIDKQERKLTTLFQEMGWQRTVLLLLGLVLLMGSGAGWFAYRAYQQKQLFLEQEQYQKKLISQQNNILEKQKARIEVILQEVRDSIKYGLRIQNAVLPSQQKLMDKLPGDYFIFSKPKDIVSGDFYFVDEQGDWILAAVADCTGHGVPGAFVSLLCISLLNETINSNGNLKANEILHILREQIISLLNQKNEFGEPRDGMDISLVLINKNKKEAQWAGANNPLFRYSKKEGILLEYKPDKQPIGIHPKMSDFTNHKIDLTSGDVLYLITDGFADQFGGSNGKKFMKKRLRTLLAENAAEKMSKQELILGEELDNWMLSFDQKQEQVDDITILGIGIN